MKVSGEILLLFQKELFTREGRISAEIAKEHATAEFEKKRVKQDHLFESDFDRFLIEDGGDT